LELLTLCETFHFAPNEINNANMPWSSKGVTEQAGAVDGPVLSQAVLARGKGRADFVVTPLAFRALARPVPVLVPQLTGDVLPHVSTGPNNLQYRR
jgi:hypothetical protein